MDQERNPNKNAELSMEQNYNQIDGIINNLPVPPPEDKPLDKVREHPPSAAAGSVRSVDKKRRRSVHLHVMVTPEEQVLIGERMAEAGISNMGPICGKWPSMAMCSMLTSRTSGSWCLSSGAAPTTLTKWRSM